jgi:hypothetical protein
MGLLKSVDNVPGIDCYEYRDILYYNKYEYKLRFDVFGARFVYFCKDEDDIIVRLSATPKGYGRVLDDHTRKEATKNIPALVAICKYYHNKRKKSNKFTIRIEHNTIGFYSNELSVLQDIEAKIGSKYKLDYTQAITSQYAGTKQFVNEPKHKFRVYLKSKRVKDGFKKEFTEFLSRNPKLYPSNNLFHWAKGGSVGFYNENYSKATHYIEYDDESMLSYLALMYGDMLGRKYKLEKRPDTI